MNVYSYNVDLPFTKNQINFREVNTQEQLFLAKANLNYNNDTKSLFDYFNSTKKLFEGCIENKESFNKISLIEYVLFLIKLRIVSVGLYIEFLLNNNKNQKTKIKIDLRSYLRNLYSVGEFFENDKNAIISDKNISIKLGWPKISSIETFQKFILENKNEYQIITNTLQEYVEFIEINNKKIIFDNFNYFQKIEMIDSIPMVLKNKIQDKVIEAITFLFNKKLFDVKNFENERFNFYNLKFIEHIKMFFAYDIKSLYTEIYYLASVHLSPDYVLKTSPSERKIYLSIIEEQQKAKDNKNDSFSNAIAEQENKI